MAAPTTPPARLVPLLLALAASLPAQQHGPGYGVGDRFVLPRLEGAARGRLSDHLGRGRPVVVFNFASW